MTHDYYLGGLAEDVGEWIRALLPEWWFPDDDGLGERVVAPPGAVTYWPTHDIETPSAMPPPWESAWRGDRGWPARPAPTYAGPSFVGPSFVGPSAVREPPVVAPPGAITYGPAVPGYVISAPPGSRHRGTIPPSGDEGGLREGAPGPPPGLGAPPLGFRSARRASIPPRRPTPRRPTPRPAPRRFYAATRRLSALGQWEDVGAWETVSAQVDTGGGTDYWGGGGDVYTAWDYEEPVDYVPEERSPPPDIIWTAPDYEEPVGYVPEERGPTVDVISYTTEQLEQAARDIVGASNRTFDVTGILKAGVNTLTDLAKLAAPILKQFFPAGFQPIWTPCNDVPGTYRDGSKCATRPGLCPQGQVWTGAGCRAMNVGDLFGSGLFGGGEGGGIEGLEGLGLSPTGFTQQWWFWPIVLGGGVLVLIVSTRRR